MIKGIIFDFGGVLIENPSEKRYKQYSKFIENPENIRKKLKNLMSLLELGKISSEEFWLEGSKKIGIKKGLFKKIWIDELEKCKYNKNVLGLVNKLKQKGYKIGLLSNVSRIDYLKKGKRICQIFYPNIFLSFKIGYKKPSEKIFKFALRKLKLSPEEVIFIDNRMNNVESAKRIGMIGIHFSSSEKLIEDLRKLGVL
ncbi:MAG: HAD family phosphatase [Candidatus Aenigmatarchaeota archaeon]